MYKKKKKEEEEKEKKENRKEMKIEEGVLREKEIEKEACQRDKEDGGERKKRSE